MPSLIVPVPHTDSKENAMSETLGIEGSGSSSRELDGQRLDFPLHRPSALEAPQEWPELRTRCPVARIALPSGDDAYLITRYADVRQVLSDPRFTRMGQGAGAARLTDTESGGVFTSGAGEILPQTGAAHQHWRRMLSKWFTAKRMAALRPQIEEVADGLIDKMLAGPKPADLKASLGFPLPVWVICMLLGVPDSDRDQFAYWSDNFLNLDRYTEEETRAAQQDFVGYLYGHVQQKRREPGDDILGTMITDAAAAGEPISDELLIATGQGLLVAGHETTANMIGKMTAVLLADRSRWEELLADRTLVRTAVEEVLRMDTNLGFGMPRYITEDLELSGEMITPGTTLICDMGAANRDGQAFDHPDELDLARTPNPHLTFGAGPNSCLGQMLARTELQAVLDVILRRLPTLRLAVDPSQLQRIEGLIVGGLRTVPVTW
jgi:cytochrome P450